MSKDEKKFLFEILDKIVVSGIVAKTMVVIITRKLASEEEGDEDE